MIQLKEHDWVLNLMLNPNLKSSDFVSFGINADNTSLQKEDVYKQNKAIQESELFKNDSGQFDASKFHSFYENALQKYNALSNHSQLKKLDELSAVFGMDDIYAPIALRKTWEDTVLYGLAPNPDRLTMGLIRVGQQEAKQWSADEIAQTQQVLKNPLEAAADIAKGIFSSSVWDESPNDQWFKNFFKGPKVLATWDEDGTHIDPITGQEVLHLKGERKLNENGTYYYEELEGRDIYGKQVLNNMNVLTTDGSWTNRHLDFFDSDDIHNSAGKTLLKNTALVGSMFLPYVGPWVAGASVFTQSVGLLGTLGKMLTGSESPTFSAMEGWSKSWNRQTAKSEYSLQHTWCLENFINLIGDVAGQLKEQRFLFEFLPAVVKGNKVLGWKGISPEKQKAFAQELAKLITEKNRNKLMKLWEDRGDIGITQTEKEFWAMNQSASQIQGQKVLDNFMKSYNKIGEVTSKAYMTAITVGDTYGELKSEGNASDLEATAITLGYAAMEAKLLNTGIGEWVLPELRGARLQRKLLIRTLTQMPKEQRAQIVREKGIKGAFNYFFKLGANTAEKVATSAMSKGKAALGGSLAAGLGEGVEEVSEEFLADFSKSAYNVVQMMKGSENRVSAWDNMVDRYGMSFVGGAVGGSLTNIGTSYKMLTQPMTTEAARQQLIYAILNNEEGDILKTLDKMDVGNKNLSFEVQELQNGDKVWKPANSLDLSQDAQMKQAFRNQVKLLKDIITAEGLNVPLSQFLDVNTLHDIRLAVLQDSVMSTAYILDFLDLSSKIVDLQVSIKELENSVPDSGTLDATQQEKLNNYNKQLQAYRQKRDSYLSGENAMDYISLSLMDLTPGFSEYFTKAFFKDYVKEKLNRNVEDLTDEEVKQQRVEFEKWKNEGGYRDRLREIGPLVLQMARNSGVFIDSFVKNYDAMRKNKSLMDLLVTRLLQQNQINQEIAETGENKNILQADEEGQSNWVLEILNLIKDEGIQNIIALINLNNPDFYNNVVAPINALLLVVTDPTQIQQFTKRISDLTTLEFLNNIPKYLDEILSIGAINPDIKHSLQKTMLMLRDTKNELVSKGNNVTLSDIKKLEDSFKTLGISLNPSSKISELHDLETLTGNPNIAKELFKELGLPSFGKVSVDTLINQALSFLDESGIGGNATDLSFQEFSDIITNLNNTQSTLDAYSKKVDDLTYTDTVNYIKNFIQANSDSNLDFEKLIETVNGVLTLNLDDLATADFSGLIDQINEGLQVIDWLKGITFGARYDSNVGLGNLMGYNVSLNLIAKEHKQSSWIPLPEINSDISDIINLDLDILKHKLLLAKNLYYINTGKKSQTQSITATNKIFLQYNSLKKFIINIDDEWVGKDTILTAINDADKIAARADSLDQKGLTQQEREEIEKQAIAIDNAIYEFFLKNQTLIANGKLYKLFINDHFNLYDLSKNLITPGTTELSSRDFLNYLATRVAVKHSAFNNEWRLVIEVNSGKAPLQSQEDAVYLNLAFVLQGNVVNNFIDAYNKAVYEDLNSKSLDDRELILQTAFEGSLDVDKVLKDLNYIVNTKLHIRFKNIALTEGIPGSGKTAAVDYFTVQILKKFHKDLVLKKAFIVNNTHENAEKLNKLLDIPDSKVFSLEEFLKWIKSDYNTKREQDENGFRKYSKDEFHVVDGMIIPKVKPEAKSTDNVPSIIFLDEVTLCDEVDLHLIQELAAEHGITVIATGDLDLSIQGAILEESPVDGDTLGLSPIREYFMGGPKLGVSMRTSNSQMDKTITTYQARESGSTDVIETYYYEDESGLNGVKSISDNSSDTVRAELLKLVDTAGGEKIGFIYYNDSDPVYQLIQNEFSDKFDVYKGTSAQGLEGKYFVVSIDAAASSPTIYNDIYTGFTRSEKGCLVIDQGGYTKSTKEDSTTYSKQSPQVYNKLAEKRKAFLDEINEGDEIIGFNPRNTAGSTTSTTSGATSSTTTTSSGSTTSGGATVPPIGPTKVPTPPVIKKTPIPDKLFSIKEILVTENGNKVSKSVIKIKDRSLNHTDADRAVVLVDINGFTVPFYCSTGKGGKKKVPTGKWYPFWGCYDANGTGLNEGWFNKLDLDTILRFYDIPFLQGVAEYLNNTYGDLTGANLDNFTEAIDPDVVEETAGGNPDVWARHLINESLNPTSYLSQNSYNEVKAEVDRFRKHFEAFLNSLLSLAVGDSIKINDYKGVSGVFKLKEIKPKLDSWTYVFTDGVNPDDLEIDYKEVESNPTIFESTKLAPLTWTNPDLLINIEYNGEEYISDGDIVAHLVNGEYELVTGITADSVLQLWEMHMNQLPNPDEEGNPTQAPDLNNSNQQKPPLNFWYLLHSFNTLEFGMNADAHGNITYQDPKAMDRYEKRIDGVFGLMKLLELDWKNPKLTKDVYVNKLALLRLVLFHTKEKADILPKLTRVLSDKQSQRKVIDIEFGLFSRVKPGKNKWGCNKVNDFNIFDMYEDESSIGSATDSKIHPKVMSAVITLDSGERMIIPLFQLANINTLLNNVKSDAADRLNQLALANGGPQTHEYFKAVANDSWLKANYPHISNLATLFNFTQGGYLKIDNVDWTPAKSLKNFGLLINTGTNPMNGKPYVQHPMSIQEVLAQNPGIRVSQIYTTATYQGVANNAGVVVPIANKGHAFVLISSDPSLSSDLAMLALWEALLADEDVEKKVLLVYVTPPKVPVRKALENLMVQVTNGTGANTKLLSATTPYTIWKHLDENDPKLHLSDTARKTISKIKLILKTIDDKKQAAKQQLEQAIANKDQVLITKLNGDINQASKDMISYLMSTLSNGFTPMRYLNGRLQEILLTLGNTTHQANLDYVVNLLESNGLSEYVYSVKFAQKPTNDWRWRPIAVDSTQGRGKYSIDGLDFTINSKIDSDMFVTDSSFDTIVAGLVNKIVPNGKTLPNGEPMLMSTDSLPLINSVFHKPSTNNTNLKRSFNLQGTTVEYTYDGTTVLKDGKPSKLTWDLVKSIKIPTALEIIRLGNYYNITFTLSNVKDIIDAIEINYLNETIPDIKSIIQSRVRQRVIEFNSTLRDNNSLWLIDKLGRVKKFAFKDLDKYGVTLEFDTNTINLTINPNNTVLHSKGGTVIKISENELSIELEQQAASINAQTINPDADVNFEAFSNILTAYESLNNVVRNAASKFRKYLTKNPNFESFTKFFGELEDRSKRPYKAAIELLLIQSLTKDEKDFLEELNKLLSDNLNNTCKITIKAKLI